MNFQEAINLSLDSIRIVYRYDENGNLWIHPPEHDYVLIANPEATSLPFEEWIKHSAAFYQVPIEDAQPARFDDWQPWDDNLDLDEMARQSWVN